MGGFESPSLTCQVTDAGLAHLSGLKGLEELHIDGTQITDAGLAQSRGLTAMQILSLNDTSVSDAGLEQLRGLTALRGLYLNQTLVTNAALEILRPLPRLDKLGLANTAVTDDVLPLIASRTELIWLMLSDTAITDEELSQLNGLPKLARYLFLNRTRLCGSRLHELPKSIEGLWLNETRVTDSQVGHLAELPNLAVLALESTAIGDQGLNQLARLPKLGSVGLGGTRVTDAGLAAFSASTTLWDLNLDDSRRRRSGRVAHVSGISVAHADQNHRGGRESFPQSEPAQGMGLHGRQPRYPTMSIPEPKPHRRWGRCSLRTLLAVVTIVAIWLGIVADRAVRQRRAVAVVRKYGGEVYYRQQRDRFTNHPADAEPLAPRWLRRWMGDDFFLTVGGLDMAGPPLKKENWPYPAYEEMSDDEFAELAGLTSLEYMQITGLGTDRRPLRVSRTTQESGNTASRGSHAHGMRLWPRWGN